MINLEKLARWNAARWQSAALTRPFEATARRLIAAKPRYQAVEARTGVPWYVVAVIHQRESSQSWKASLAQGDPWDRVSTHVPKGRGPFASWEDAAVDALVNCAPYAARNDDWSVGGTLTMLERYNGLGYATKGVPSPYLWAGTNQYVAGKYVRDGVYDPTAIDKQLGCAGLIKTMMAMDSGIAFGVAAKPPPDPQQQASSAQPPARAAFFMAVAAALARLFRRA